MPTVACLTQSMMYPRNEEKVGEVLRAVAEAEAPALYAEAPEARHQEVSDYPSLSYWPLRLVCMAGHQNPHTSHVQLSSLAVGFLATVGVFAAEGGSPQLERMRSLTSGMLLPAEGGAPPRSEYVVHGAALPATGEWRARVSRWTPAASLAGVKAARAPVLPGGLARAMM